MSGMFLNLAAMGVGMHMSAWRFRNDDPFSYLDLEFYKDIATRVEKAGFHALFLADTLTASEENFERPNYGAVDPTIILAALSSVTESIGLIATATTSFTDPFTFARRFATLDQISRGRVGWNIVTTYLPAVAANFGASDLPKGQERYAMAEEFVDVVDALWKSWPNEAKVGDREGGVFANADLIQPIDHVGKYYKVKGPLTLPCSEKGRPALIQAGSSEEGRQLAARVADAVFTAQNTLSDAQVFYADMKRRARDTGRDPETMKILPGLFTVIGKTEAEAKARKAKLDELVGDAQLRKLARRVGLRVEDLELDALLPIDKIMANKDFRGSEGFRDAAVQMARTEKLTVRQIVEKNGGGQFQLVGTPEYIAETMETWFNEKACDGFNVQPDVLTDGLTAFADGVLPILRKKGLFFIPERGTSLRERMEAPSRPGIDEATFPAARHIAR